MIELLYIINRQTMNYGKTYVGLLALTLMLLCGGCSGGKVKNIAKSDIDIAADTIVRSLDDYIRRLTLELYRTNPEELAETDIKLEQRLNQIIEYPVQVAYHEIHNKQQIKAIELALDDSYDGDRVFALMIGISSMIRLSYDNQREFFLFDTIDPQKLYDSSYNLQLLKRKLIASKLLRIDADYAAVNNAYVLIEKIGTTQDLMSRIISDKTSRLINKTLIGTATTFIPVI